MQTFECILKGYFNLINQSRYFDNCANLSCHSDKQVVVSFPVEKYWEEYATVVLQQPAPNLIRAEVHASDQAASAAFKQALSIISADVDGSSWKQTGEKDPVIGALQKQHDFLRPNLFHSPYEAAAAFIIGNRMSIKQRQLIMHEMAKEMGGKMEIDGNVYYAFPSPPKLLEIASHKSLNNIKIQRLKTIARAAIDGLLDRDFLLSLPVEIALTELKSIPGIGEFYAQAILFRGAGIINEITQDDLTRIAIEKAYQTIADEKMISKITANWDPFKMWCTVLLHIWLRHTGGIPAKRKFIAKARQKI